MDLTELFTFIKTEKMKLSFATTDGTLIKGELHEPSGKCRGIIVLIHGLGEHFGRYRIWAGRFTSAGYAVLGADLPGHGLSGGRRGHISSYDITEEVIESLIARGSEVYPSVPVILYGHSLGGGIALRYIIRRKPEICCAIITSPWLKLSFEPQKIKMLLATAMKSVLPGMVQPSGLVVGYLSRDPEVVREYLDDPLVHNKISVSLFNEAVTAAKFVLGNATGINLPILLMHGADDMITSPGGSRIFADLSGSTDLKIFEGGYHELHNDIIREEVFGFMAGWVAGKCESAS